MTRQNIIRITALLLTTSLISSCDKKLKFTYTEVEASKQDIITSVTATGTIEPVTSVDVGTQVSGIVSKLYVDYNSIVKAGDVIAELDRTNLLSELSSAQANLKSAQSELDYQKTNHERYKNLYDKGLISANDYEQARLSYVKAQQSVANQTENVKKAKTNLGYATITSPIDGIVLSKEVEEGQTVASSFNTPTLFTIAQDLTDMRVIADVDEADIGDVKEGQRVTFTVDAFPEDTFEGSVTQVRQQATTESNVVTYQVVISAPNEDLKLKPGLTANVTIYTLELKNVLAVPAKALRFNPSEAMLNEGEAIINVDTRTKVWTKEGPNLKAIPVELGTTNGTLTQILSGVNEGTKVITEVASSLPQMEEGAGNQQNTNPFMPRPRNNRDKDKNKNK
ncbi:MAG: efflux RND transporter periplasmic adaptor subunit [Bacteroidaceae bacterium]|jgi:HlyD family secretion protein|nr:efflux RND transporter periplasmic adaptor subunit [Bacteroidaceae bacterium]MBQ2185417.1 efflux RND transporter periplasmic adaptor subunit [Bacteroidaceae bacterium]MBR6046516.1 efflux RND transporter periplasmic adaptor subunit [Bacteroidaceae bacterium]